MRTSFLPGRRTAFTIIEIMLAITIFMLVILSIYSSWTAILRGSRAGLNAAAEVQRARVAMRTVEEALLASQMFEANMKYYYFVADTSDENFAALSFVARLPDSFPGSGMFGDQTLRRVTFTVAPQENGQSTLMMSQIPPLILTNNEIQPYSIPLAKDITLFNLRFWDNNMSDWVDELAFTNRLPLMVEITLGFGKLNSYSHDPAEVYQRVVALPSTLITRDVQNPTPGGGLRAPQFSPVVRTMPDGTKILQDGTHILPDGSRFMPDGSRILPDGTRISKDGVRISPRPGPGPMMPPTSTVPPIRRNPPLGGRRP